MESRVATESGLGRSLVLCAAFLFLAPRTASAQHAPGPDIFTHFEGVVINTTTPSLTFQEQGGPARKWSFNSAGTFGFFLSDDVASTTPFGIVPGAPTNSLHLAGNGDVGLGIFSPTSSLHVYRTNGTARLTVEENSGVTQERVLFHLRNRGKTRFLIENAATGVLWTFDNDGANFSISKVGTGVNELLLDGSGNLTIRGQLSTGSDAAAKTGLRPVDGREVLARVLELPLSRWRYAQGPAAEHLGPMAQDFHTALGLGADERHIAPMDAGGVALAAIQGLHAELREENQHLRDENRRLAERLGAMEAALARLEASPR